ncbi:PfkB family carbohydrate kinase [Gleimia hominis]|uniref:PfkB family carbohydrate kinase n=1 Tax=Gleimia hominis TaxID=595468 RepID=A0ABU3IAW6_9ACTO|nr:PfkB family carbohydrate kinase [Gleimia hominis]MDT3767515.1 PfkB family carbohydrate kinase [Gleimia hominis]
MSRFISTQPIHLNLPTSIPKLPERGEILLASSMLAAPGGGFLGLAAAGELGVHAAALSVLGSGPNSFVARRVLRQRSIEILTEEMIGDIGVAMQLVEEGGYTTTVLSVGVESDPPLAMFHQVEVQPGDVVLVHGLTMTNSQAAKQIARWAANLDESITVVLCPSPMLDQIDPEVWPMLLHRADYLSLNLREARILPGLLEPGEVGWQAVAERMRPNTVVVRRMGSIGCEYHRNGDAASRVVVPAFHVPVADTSGVGDIHVGAMCGALAVGHDVGAAVLIANAAGAVMISHEYSMHIPSLDDLMAFLDFDPTEPACLDTAAASKRVN